MSVKKNADGVDPFSGADPLLVSYVEVTKDPKTGKKKTVVGERRLTPEEAWPESEPTE